MCHAALARPTSERAAFLAGACGDDEDLRLEVESLVARADSASSFLESPVGAVASPSLIGRQLGAYRIEQSIGAGGMAEVYRAKDTRLGRDVALKILPAAWAANPRRRARFEREARAIATLNHPNICTIHDVGHDQGTDFLVMELVDGESLAALLGRGPLPLDQALARAIEIADGLDKAHRHGIIHRDLKPGNVMLTRTGTGFSHSKLLDFGLARIVSSEADGAPPPDATMTDEGMVLGTLQYMAPEQIEGRPADVRTDIFAFGALLYEMVTGRRAFGGSSSPALMAAILRDEPASFESMQPPPPRALERLVRTCLAKKPDDRYSSMHDVLLELQWIASGETDSRSRGPRPWRRRRYLALAGTALTAVLLTLVASWWLLGRTDYFWRNPLDNAQFQNLTDFGGTEQAAAVSRDGRFVAFLSNREGPLDVWVTQVGAGVFYNLTRGRFQGLGNPSLRMLGFSPDGALVTFWARGIGGSNASEISVWAVPTLGGQPRPYLEGVAEFDWSSDGSRLVYHTPGPGDPMFVKDSRQRTEGQQIFAAAAGLHAHFPLWSPDADFIYFVQGSLPDSMDIWRIRPTGGAAERITYHNSRVSQPVLLNHRTLMYLATDRDGSGPWLHALDVERRVPHRVGAGLDRYTSLAASADGRRLVATLANPNGTLWRLPIAETPGDASAATPISLTTGRGFSPRLGPGYLLYVSSKGASDGVWKLAEGAATELWSAPETRIIGGPEIARDGRGVTFSVEQRGRTVLYTMNADGTNARVLTESLELRGAPAWTPDGQSITSAANVDGTPHLFRISLDGGRFSLVQDYSLDPVWSPDGEFLVYSGADIGTTFPVKAVSAAGSPYAIPNLTLTRGARRLRFQGRRALVVMRGDIEHKDLWLIDLETGAERQLTNLPTDFNVRDFDVSPDGREIVLERVQEQSNVVLIDLARHD